MGAALLPTVAEVANGGDVAGAIGDRAAMLAGGLAAALAMLVAGFSTQDAGPSHMHRPACAELAMPMRGHTSQRKKTA
jgi:hypothetical protein